MEIFTHLPRIYLFIFAGLLGVGDVISWGIYGDLLAEKFHPLSIIRSLILGLIYSVCIFIKSPNLPLIIVVLSVIALERSTTELYKALIRDQIWGVLDIALIDSSTGKSYLKRTDPLTADEFLGAY